MKVLMVHGCVQNAAVFSTRTSNLRSKALKNPGNGKFEFVFAESPLPAHPLLTAEGSEADGRSWYTPQEVLDGDASVRPVNSKAYREWQEPLAALRSLAHQQGPFIGMMAFSQGGVPAAVLLSEMRDRPMKFAIFVSCFGPLDPEVCRLLEAGGQNPIELPTMHVIATSDPFVAASR